MKTPLILLLAFVTMSVVLLAAQPTEEKPFWHADWPTAQRIAKKENKPVFAVLVCKH